MIRVLVVDDHTLVRKGLKQILEDDTEIIVADEAAKGKEVFDKFTKNDYDVVLLDISLPGRDGIDVLKQLKCLKPSLPVLILSMHPEEQYAIRSIRAGAFGYLTKESAPEELIDAIKKVAKGRKYITSSLAEKLAYELDNNTEKPAHEILSDREYEVMRMIAAGKTVKEIAESLCLSVKTISTFRSRILRKLNLKNNSQIIRYAFEQHLIA